MKDGARIRPFLDALEEFWSANPHLRFGQLMMNLSRDEHMSFQDVWEWDCDEFRHAIKQARKTWAA